MSGTGRTSVRSARRRIGNPRQSKRRKVCFTWAEAPSSAPYFTGDLKTWQPKPNNIKELGGSLSTTKVSGKPYGLDWQQQTSCRASSREDSGEDRMRSVRDR